MDAKHRKLSVRRQCELLGLNRSSWYLEPVGESEENLRLMRLIDEQYLKTPFYGSRRMAVALGIQEGSPINRKRVSRLMRVMGIESLYPKPRLSERDGEHRVFPYLLREITVDRVNQVWSTDITYVPLRRGFLYLTAVLDWHSRHVLSWRLSNTLDVEFCLEALDEALRVGKPEIFNTDQGSQFTSRAWTSRLEEAGIRISMDGKGRALDNVFVERLWRTVKYENVYLQDYATGEETEQGLRAYFDFYGRERPHQSLNSRTPESVYFGK